ncbi:FixH family protein [Sphingobium olei]|uniref:FixH family protein n=1 Tax=Sphingobium olei TaxID=420955 RepID=A0ABW3P2Y2_9SPHN
MRREFTGRHMLFVMLGMFGTIIAVNLIMARFAVSTFGGTVVENSYVASQNYNRWLAEARAQDDLGWSIDLKMGDGRTIQVRSTPQGGTLTGLAEHPLGRAPDQLLNFTKSSDGAWRSTEPLPPGRWRVRLELRSGEETARFVKDVPA